MLVLSRKVGERILVGDQIRITVVRVTNGGVRLGIEAPDGTTVIREELTLKKMQSASSTLAPPHAQEDAPANVTGGRSPRRPVEKG